MAQQEQVPIQLWQTVMPCEFVPHVKDRTQAQSLLIATRQGAGYHIAAGQLAHAIQSRATHILMDFSQAACAIRYQVDGNWEQLPPLDRETGDAMLYALKQLCLLNPADRRSSQSGKLGLKIAKSKFQLQFQSQGVPTGERVLAKIEPEKIPYDKLSDLGMRDKMIETLKLSLNESGKVVLLSAPKGEGLSTTWVVTVNAADRLIRDFQSFDNKEKPEPDIININPNYYGGDTGLTELELVNKLILKEPDVLMFPELPEEGSMTVAIHHVENTEKSLYTRMVAPSAMDAFVQLVHKYPKDSAEIAKCTGAVLSQRLVRRLCENCKVGFEPPPQLLHQLGIPQGRVALLYQPFVPPPIELQVDEKGNPAPIMPCYVCEGRGYFGRIGIFELLTPGERLKAAVLKTRDVSQLYRVAKEEGHRGIQAEAILTVSRGLTSLDELKRAFAKK